jgi:membrane fusion protein (multidrug efflux system)
MVSPQQQPAPEAPQQGDPRAHAAAVRKLRKLVLIIVIATVVAVAAVLLFFYGRVTTDDAYVDAHITPVSAKISGYVAKLNINDNTPVQEGGVLLQIDPRDYEAALGQAQGTYDYAVAEADRAKLAIGLTRQTTYHDTSGAAAQKDADVAALNSSEVELETAATAALLQAKANVEAKRATNARAQSDLERYKPLVATDDVSKFQYDAVVAAADVAKSELLAAEQQLAAAEKAVAVARANANAARARLVRSNANLEVSRAQQQQVPITEATYKSMIAQAERAQAALDQAKLNLSYCTILAPISGQVTQKTVELGQYVSPGQLLLTLVPLDKIYVTANFKETQLKHVHPGQRARIYVDTYGRDFGGTVDSLAAATGSKQALLPPQNATGNFVKIVQRIPIKILVDNTKESRDVLRPGMSVEATIYTH